MAIIFKEKENVFIELGFGDVEIGSGYTPAGTGLIFLKGVEASEIGVVTNHNNKVVDVDDYPVMFFINDTRSIDAMIRRLKETKQHMIDIQEGRL